MLTIHEFGKDNKEILVLVHPAVVMWDYFEYLIPLMENRYHLVIPALPGYDESRPRDFTSVEDIAKDLEKWLEDNGYSQIAGIYGCSMGGAVVLRFLADNRILTKCAVIDGGITPYRLPWLLTRLIVVRDFALIAMGKLGGLKLLEKAFSTDDYSEEDLEYVARVLRQMSAKTIWRTFESANNYTMPETVHTDCKHVEYWFSKAEEKDRKWDIAYVKETLPGTHFRRYKTVGHGGLAALAPEKLAKTLERLMSGSK